MRKFMNVTLYRPAKKLLGPAVIGGAAVLMSATASMAGVTEMFAAVDFSGFATGLETVFLALIGIALLGAGYVYIKRAIPGRF